jgi:hypothetical protein
MQPLRADAAQLDKQGTERQSHTTSYSLVFFWQQQPQSKIA